MLVLKRCLALLLTTLFWIGLPASAGAEKKPAPHKTDEITVTATKTDSGISQLIGTATVIDEEAIKISGITDLTDVLRYTPGVGFKRVGGPGQYVYTNMRGFNDGHFVVVIDGMKINDGMSSGTGNLFSKLDPFLLERVEVLQGPQAVLYGSNTTAGVMAFNTKGGLPGQNVTAGAEYGTYQWKKGYGGFRGQSGKFRYSVNGTYIDSDGIHEYEDFKNGSIQTKLGYNYNGIFDAEFSYMHINSEWNYSKLIESYAFCSSRADWYGFQVPDPSNYNKEKYDLATLNLKHKINDKFRQKLMVGWYKKKTESNNPNNGLLGYISAPQNNFTLDYVNYFNKGASVPVYDDGTGIPSYYENNNYQADYNLIYDQKFSGGLNTLLFGLEWLSQEGKKWGRYGDNDGRLDTKSVYVNDQVRLLDEALLFSGGVRYDDNKDFENEATYKVGAAYSFKQVGTTLFADYGTSFRVPTISNLYDPQYGNDELKPEKGWTVEGGIRQDLLDKKAHVELSFWHTELKDVIAFEYTSYYNGHYVNRDKQKTQGVEFSFFWNFYGNFALLGNYTYTDSQSEEDGETYRTVLIARNTANLGIQYNWREKLFAGIHGYYVGPRLRWNGDLEMDAYTRCDVYARYSFWKGFSLYGRVNNLFDADIEEGMGYEAPGVYLTAGLSWDFDLSKLAE